MKLLKLNSVKLSMIITMLYAIIQVTLMNAYMLIIVDDVSTLFKNATILVFLYIMKNLLLGINERCKAISSFYLKRQMGAWMDAYISEQTYEKFNEKDANVYVSVYVNDIPQIITLQFVKLNKILYNLILVIAILVSLLLIHWMIFVMGIVMICVMCLLPRAFHDKLGACILYSQKSKETFLNDMTEVMHGFSLFFENKVFGLFRKKTRKSCYSYAKSICKVDSFAGWMSAILEFAGSFISILTLVLLSYLVIKHKVPAATLLATISLMPSLSDAVSEIASDKTFLDSGKRLFAFKFTDITYTYCDEFCKPCTFTYTIDKEERDKTNQYEKIQEIITKDIVVKYKEKMIKIKDCHFEAPKKYAIIGDSGKGKSTLLKVIIGEIENYDGNVYVNGKLKTKKATLFQNIAYVNQKIFLLNGSLMENITLGNNVREDTLYEIMKLCGLSDFSLSFIIKENGKNLSGGQRQRIALARALALDKSVIILDEATANLDKGSAFFIECVLMKLDCLVIMVTHHLSDILYDKLDTIIDLNSIDKTC